MSGGALAIFFCLIGPEARKRLTVPIVVLQTAAANLSSMLTPIGNPQNLYLYGRAGLSLGAFFLSENQESLCSQ